MHRRSEIERSAMMLMMMAITHIRVFKLAPYHGRDFTDAQLVKVSEGVLDHLEHQLQAITPQKHKKAVAGSDSGDPQTREHGANPTRKKVCSKVSEVR
ncbi:hypothetical protein GI374_06880 [Paracoccus sp. S-4012]|uniref:hypothetical protein n=1 Tax=Paracoccus sp. S-4012 TaxID=2665648 RepID=UPI0012B0356B|nr:hypothetical protein [Paracoccus sp. S-4012]MRX50176.1 hypothetical protein [Paracoccus sp. S-4012]